MTERHSPRHCVEAHKRRERKTMTTTLTLNSDVIIDETTGDICVGCKAVRVNGVPREFVAVFKPARYLRLVKGRTVGDVTIRADIIDEDIESADAEGRTTCPVLNFSVNGNSPLKFPSFDELMEDHDELSKLDEFIESRKQRESL